MDLRRAGTLVGVVFGLNGFAFASWMSRLPDVRHLLELHPGGLGRLLLALSVGSLLGLPAAGRVVAAVGPGRAVAVFAWLDALGLVVAAVGAGAAGSTVLTGAGLFLYGVGTAIWDVAMNVEAAEVERRSGRSIMPRFHAAFSLGTVAAAGVGAGCSAAGVPVLAHLLVVAAVAGATPTWAVRGFAPARPDEHGPVGFAWREPRTLVLGVLVLALALTEGVANDWLAVGLVDGYAVPRWLGSLGFAGFVAAMTVGRVLGTPLLDRHGRVRVLWGTVGCAGAGVLLVVLGATPVLVVLGILVWGLGASLGFPVGMSAAADDPTRAAARVSVVSTIGYLAFLAGPPLLGSLGDAFGVLPALLVVVVVLVPASLAVPATRPPQLRTGENRAA